MLKEKIKTLGPRKTVLAMVNGLRREWVHINMSTFGIKGLDENYNTVSYGCAATNAVCEILQTTIPPDFIEYRQHEYLDVSGKELKDVLFMFDLLRTGIIKEYDFLRIPKPIWTKLPALTNDNYKTKIDIYEKWANGWEFQIRIYLNNIDDRYKRIKRIIQTIWFSSR